MCPSWLTKSSFFGECMLTNGILFINRTDRYQFCVAFRSYLDEVGSNLTLHVTHEDRASCMADLATMSGVKFHQIPRINAPGYEQWTVDCCQKNNIRFIWASGDHDLVHLASLKETLEKSGTKLVIGDRRLLYAVLDKASYENFAAGGDWGIPKTKVIDGSLHEAFESYLGNYPYIVKPRNGLSSKDTELVRNKRQLDPIIGRSPDYILQQFITGDAYTVDVLANEDSTQFTVGVRKRALIAGPHSICINSVSDHHLIRVARQIVGTVKLPGIWNFQFIQCAETRKCYVHDVNPRMGNGLMHSIARGMPVFEWIRAQGEGKQVPVGNVLLKSNVNMKIYQQYIFTN